MMKMGKRALLVACGCMLLLSGCTKSNIVQPDASEAEEPDFNVYNNIELDMDQFHEEVNEICLDEDDYPMADSIDFTIDEDKVPDRCYRCGKGRYQWRRCRRVCGCCS